MTRRARSKYRIAMIPGDGIGREVVEAAALVLEQLDIDFQFEWLSAGWDAFEQTGSALPAATLEAVHTCDGAIFGAVSSPSSRVEGYSSPIIALRKALDLYGNLRPVVSAHVQNSRPGVDMLIVRENTEGLYIKRETLSEDGEEAIAQRVITRRASTRIARLAFEQAQARAASQDRRPMVTIAHKANVLSISDGLFRESCLAVAQEYPGVRCEEQLVDSLAYRMIIEPERYDVIVAPNLYGDILSDAAAALVGGLGIAPSANMGNHFMLVEPVHGSAPDIAGKGIANPIAAVLSSAMLLRYLGEDEAAEGIETAVAATIEDGLMTPDLGGSNRTEEVTEAICERL